MWLDVLKVAAGVVLLFLGGNYLLKSSVSIAQALQIPKIIIGMTIVSFATSAPELIVSMNAAFSGNSAIALGNVVGSNIANIGLVLGLVLILTPIDIQKGFYKTDWPMLMLISGLLALFLFVNPGLQRWEGLVLLLLISAFLFFLIKYQTKAVVEDEHEDVGTYPIKKALIFLVIAGVILWLGSEWLVSGASEIAQQIGISERVIAISVVAVGTSIPELAASLIAIANKEKAIGLGNVIGSNIFNIGSVLGITAMLLPVPVTDPRFLEFDIWVMMGISAILLPMVFLPKNLTLSRWEGIGLLAIYIGFIYFSLS